MRTAGTKTSGPRKGAAQRQQVNMRVDPAVYRALEAIARQQRRSVPQAARQLIEDGLRLHAAGRGALDKTRGDEIAILAANGGAFDWLDDEPELYDDTSGEPV